MIETPMYVGRRAKAVSVERSLLIAALGLLNSTGFKDDREPIREDVVRDLQQALGYRIVGDPPPLRPAHKATDMLPGRHPNDAQFRPEETEC